MVVQANPALFCQLREIKKRTYTGAAAFPRQWKTSLYLCYSLSAGTVTGRAWAGLGPCVTPNVNINCLFYKTVKKD